MTLKKKIYVEIDIGSALCFDIAAMSPAVQWYCKLWVISLTKRCKQKFLGERIRSTIIKKQKKCVRII